MMENKQGKKKWYACNPELNTDCRKMSCFLYAGPCFLTSNKEYAVKDKSGKPIEQDPRRLIKEKMKR